MKAIPTADEAREIAQRFIDGHFGNKGEHPRVSIPARPEYDDDLRLMAFIDRESAAPDLLEALRELHGAVAMIVGNDSPVLQSAQAAIAKATGEQP